MRAGGRVGKAATHVSLKGCKNGACLKPVRVKCLKEKGKGNWELHKGRQMGTMEVVGLGKGKGLKGGGTQGCVYRHAHVELVKEPKEQAQCCCKEGVTGNQVAHMSGRHAWENGGACMLHSHITAMPKEVPKRKCNLRDACKLQQRVNACRHWGNAMGQGHVSVRADAREGG